ncbi:hypothetical protein A5320_13555 [Rheinheimera sp. SA_1]|uniref:DUF969 domain-containing protein n=1 Tax=Rheinheimera sp. SA_1 TaxID=1827365 RepID=UPI000800081E|nr:DUF969 domain-containing protein [Rheinheimera sp. SA_1]OBP14745.1 hypothetical protein A5320_13555 [Rheinheimera sp. SA_1]
MDLVNLWPLLGIGVVMLGFLLKFNPVLVVLVAGIITGLAALMPIREILAQLGEGFLKTRTLPVILLLPLAVIGLAERHGLKQQAQNFIKNLKGATVGRLLTVYLAARESTAALGLTSLGGHPQMVRPLLAPMAEALAEQRWPSIPERIREKVKAMAAATDNIGLFFGEDIFVAFGAIVLMHTFLRESGIETNPLHIALWGIPTALCAFAIHAYRLRQMDQMLRRLQAQAASVEVNSTTSAASPATKSGDQA